MQIEILTLFPPLFNGFLSSSLIEKAISRKLLSICLTNIRDYADPPHHQVDDTPYGGGAGMVMRPEPLLRAIEAAKARLPQARVILLSASGTKFTQSVARELSTTSEVILICGRYEGVDQRVIDLAVDQQLCIGDYVLMGGEVPAMVVIEASARLITDVIGNAESLNDESFSSSECQLLEAPHYTRPAVFRERTVPEVLLSGDHAKIAAWKKAQAIERTRTFRPDLLAAKDKE